MGRMSRTTTSSVSASRFVTPISTVDPVDEAHSFKSLDTIGLVTHVASFSKLLAPGLRMGYVLADNRLLKRMISFKASQSSHFVSLAIEGFLINNMDQHKSNVRDILRKKCK